MKCKSFFWSKKWGVEGSEGIGEGFVYILRYSVVFVTLAFVELLWCVLCPLGAEAWLIL